MSLIGQYDTGNIFAKILRGEMPCVKVFEDEDILAFMDVFPQSRGHVLVIPKNDQCRNLLDAKPQSLTAVMAGVQNIAHAVQATLAPDGIVITQFNGAPAGQTVFHLHVHIIPRYVDAPLAAHGGGHGKMADMDELSALAAQISAAL